MQATTSRFTRSRCDVIRLAQHSLGGGLERAHRKVEKLNKLGWRLNRRKAESGLQFRHEHDESFEKEGGEHRVLCNELVPSVAHQYPIDG